MESLKELVEKRAKLTHDARAILDKADAEKRSLTSDERGEYDRIEADLEKASDEVQERTLAEGDAGRRERSMKRLAELSLPVGRQTLPGRPGERPNAGGDDGAGLTFDLGRAGKINLADVTEADSRLAEQLRARASDDYRRAFRQYLLSNQRRDWEKLGLITGDDTKGGYTAPMAFLSMLVKFLDLEVTIRRLATVLPPTTAKSVGVLSFDTDVADADWTAEVPASDIAESDTARFGRREMMPHLLTKLIKASRLLLRSSTFPIEEFLAKRLAYKFGITENKTFLSGTGQQQPLGLFTASADGIDTSRDVTASGTTTFAADDLIETKESLLDQYQRNGTWIASRAFRKQARKLKDAVGHYLLVNDNNAGSPDMLMDRPLVVDENAPNTFTTGKYVAVFGDISFYWIQDGFDLEIQRLEELLALRNQVGWLGRKTTDAMPVLAEAFARLKLA